MLLQTVLQYFYLLITPFILLPVNYSFFFPSLTEMILFQTLVLLLFSHANTLLIMQNVAFQKVNEITTTRSRWLVTFIIDLEPYEHFINKIEDDFVKTDKAVSTMSAVQDKSASHASMCHFVILQKNLLKKKKKNPTVSLRCHYLILQKFVRTLSTTSCRDHIQRMEKVLQQ